MKFIEWTDKFSVGIASVDHEHRQLIELIGAFQRKIEKDDSIDTKLEYLGEIYAQISAHFALEEKLMREFQYERYEDHKADHEKLLDQLRDIMDAAEDDLEIDNDTLGTALEAWFSRHFQEKDAHLHGKLG
ncbi:MAG: bacteriohemerythrin [Gammaproteobacteria bacterium]|nr:bacteriohemerythrin [Gammaproteobacteria bacterium]